MFKKIKLKLKNKLRNWLEIDSIDKNLSDTTYELNTYKTTTNMKLHNQKYEIDNNAEAINSIHRTIENVVHIGTDVRENRYNDGHSWAVVCIEGKINVVKFVDLNRKDAREIFDFLKHFEASRHCIDIPYSPIFYDGLFKFEKE